MNEKFNYIVAVALVVLLVLVVYLGGRVKTLESSVFTVANEVQGIKDVLGLDFEPVSYGEGLSDYGLTGDVYDAFDYPYGYYYY
jgi:hypothetical protein